MRIALLTPYFLPTVGGSELYVYDLACVRVPAKSLDNIAEELCIGSIDWIKIDVEGVEYEVLKGSRKIIRNCNPKMIVECMVDRGRTLRFIKNFEYTAVPIATNYFFFQPD